MRPLPPEQWFVCFRVLTAVVTRNFIFWDIKVCSPTNVNRRFGELCSYNLHGWRLSQIRNNPEAFKAYCLLRSSSLIVTCTPELEISTCSKSRNCQDNVRKIKRFSVFLCSSGQSSWLQIQRSGFDSRRYQIIWEVVGLERGPFSLVSTIEELLGRKCSGSGIENREYGSRDPSRWPRGTLYSK
jgi:hypothetical protein